MTASTPPSLSSSRIDTLLTRPRRALLSGATIAAGCLLPACEQVCYHCHQAVTQGERWRAEQRAPAHPGKLASQPPSRS